MLFSFSFAVLENDRVIASMIAVFVTANTVEYCLSFQLKRLEEIMFTSDPDAMFIVENTFSVLVSTFSRRKIY
jgi:hypothetical protein